MAFIVWPVWWAQDSSLLLTLSLFTWNALKVFFFKIKRRIFMRQNHNKTYVLWEKDRFIRMKKQKTKKKHFFSYTYFGAVIQCFLINMIWYRKQIITSNVYILCHDWTLLPLSFSVSVCLSHFLFLSLLLWLILRQHFYSHEILFCIPKVIWLFILNNFLI